MARQVDKKRRAHQIAFGDLRFAPLDAHPDGGRGNDMWADLLLPVYAPTGARRDGAYEAGLLEISRDGSLCFVPLRYYPVRKVYRELIAAAGLVVMLCVAGMMFGIAFFTIGNDGNPIRAEGGYGIIYVWQFEPVAVCIRLLVPALGILGAILIARSVHRSASVQKQVAIPAGLMIPLCVALHAIHKRRGMEVPDDVRESRPGMLGARASGPGGELVGAVINMGFDWNAERKREAEAAMLRRTLAESLLGHVERFGARRVSASSDQFRKLDP